MYSTHNEGNSAAAERFIRTLKIKFTNIWQRFQKNAYFNVLNDIVDKYSNKYHKTIKMKLINVKSDSFAEYTEESY